MNENESSNMSYGRINTKIILRGLTFPAGTMIRIWETGRTTSIQPISTSNPQLWYSLPQLHRRHIRPLENHLCDMIDFGIL